MLLGQWLVQVLFTPIADAAQETTQPLVLGLAFYGPASTERLGPVVREPQKRKAACPFVPLPIRSAELHHPTLVRMNAQPIPLESLGQDPEHLLCVSLAAKAHYKIIRIPRQKAVSAHSGPHLLLKPLIQDCMQKDIRQNWRNWCP